MLEIDPKKRIAIEVALAHPFLESLHNVEDEPRYSESFTFDFEHQELTKEEVQQLIWEEIREFHPELPSNYPKNGHTSSSKSVDSDKANESTKEQQHDH